MSLRIVILLFILSSVNCLYNPVRLQLVSFLGIASILSSFSMSRFAGKSIQESIQVVLGHHQNGRFPEALEGYEELLSMITAPDAKAAGVKVSLHGNAGAIYLAQGDYGAARRHFEESVKLQPENGNARYNLAVLLTSKMNNHAAALKHCALAIKYSPSNHKLYHLMGNIMQNLGKNEDAERYFTLAESIASENEEKQDSKPVAASTQFSLRSWLPEIIAKHSTIDEATVSIEGETYAVRTLSSHPLILEIEDFVSASECDWIRSQVEGKLEKSFTMGSHVTQIDGEIAVDSSVSTKVEDTDEENPALFRSSYNAWLPREEKLQDLQRKLSLLLELPHPYVMQNSEDLQVVHYKPGGQFKVHQDSSSFHPRLLTALIYLNDPPKNTGETWFPYASHSQDGTRPATVEDAVLHSLETYETTISETGSIDNLPGLRVPAKKGKIVVFVNHDSNGDIDPLAIHAGLPPRKQSGAEENGEKWVANYWIQLNKRNW